MVSGKFDKLLDEYRENDAATSIVNSFNGLTGAVVLAAGTNIILTPIGNTITISAQNDATAIWGSITGTLSNQTDLQTALDAKLSTTTADSTYLKLDQSTPQTVTSGSAGGTFFKKNLLSSVYTNRLIGTFASTIINGLDSSYDATYANRLIIGQDNQTVHYAGTGVIQQWAYVAGNWEGGELAINPNGGGVTINGMSIGNTVAPDLSLTVMGSPSRNALLKIENTTSWGGGSTPYAGLVFQSTPNNGYTAYEKGGLFFEVNDGASYARGDMLFLLNSLQDGTNVRDAVDESTFMKLGWEDNTFDVYGNRIPYTKTITQTFQSGGSYVKAGNTYQWKLVGKRVVGGYTSFSTIAVSSVLNDSTAPSDPFSIEATWSDSQIANVTYYLIQFKNGVFDRYRTTGFTPTGFLSSNGEGGWTLTPPVFTGSSNSATFPTQPLPTYYYSVDAKIWGDLEVQEDLSVLGNMTIADLHVTNDLTVDGDATIAGSLGGVDLLSTLGINLGTAFGSGAIASATNFNMIRFDAGANIVIGDPGGGDLQNITIGNPFGATIDFSTDGNVYTSHIYMNDRAGIYGESANILTGTIATNASTSVVGTGTLFLSELEIGDTITDDIGDYAQVVTITDNTHMTVDVAIGDGSTQNLYVINGSILDIDSYYGTVLSLTADGKIGNGDFSSYIKFGQGLNSTVITASGQFIIDNGINGGNSLLAISDGNSAVATFEVIDETSGTTMFNFNRQVSGEGWQFILETDNDFIIYNNDLAANAIRIDYATNVTTFGADVIVPDEAYGSAWNGSLEVPTKNAIYDKLETIASDVLFDHYADAGNTGTGEDDLYSDTIAAGQLSADGQKITATYQGTFTGAAASTQQLKIYFGGTQIYASGALSIGVATNAWTAQVTVIRESSSVVRCSVAISTDFATLFPYSSYTRITGLTLSNTQVLKLTGEAAGVGAANNQVVSKLGYVEFKPAQ